MNIVKYNIQSSEDLIQHAIDLKMKLASTLQSICQALLTKGDSDGHPVTIIRIKSNMLAESYHKIPAMFGRSLNEKEYPQNVVQSYLRGEWMYIRAGEHIIPRSFKARALRGIRINQSFYDRLSHIPVSYQKKPSLLARTLSNETGLKVCNRCKNGGIEWYTVEQDSQAPE